MPRPASFDPQDAILARRMLDDLRLESSPAGRPGLLMTDKRAGAIAKALRRGGQSVATRSPAGNRAAAALDALNELSGPRSGDGSVSKINGIAPMAFVGPKSGLKMEDLEGVSPRRTTVMRYVNPASAAIVAQQLRNIAARDVRVTNPDCSRASSQIQRWGSFGKWTLYGAGAIFVTGASMAVSLPIIGAISTVGVAASAVIATATAGYFGYKKLTAKPTKPDDRTLAQRAGKKMFESVRSLETRHKLGLIGCATLGTVLGTVAHGMASADIGIAANGYGFAPVFRTTCLMASATSFAGGAFRMVQSYWGGVLNRATISAHANELNTIADEFEDGQAFDLNPRQHSVNAFKVLTDIPSLNTDAVDLGNDAKRRVLELFRPVLTPHIPDVTRSPYQASLIDDFMMQYAVARLSAIADGGDYVVEPHEWEQSFRKALTEMDVSKAEIDRRVNDLNREQPTVRLHRENPDMSRQSGRDPRAAQPGFASPTSDAGTQVVYTPTGDSQPGFPMAKALPAGPSADTTGPGSIGTFGGGAAL